MRKFDVQSKAGELPVGRAVDKNLALGTSENRVGTDEVWKAESRSGVIGEGQPAPSQLARESWGRCNLPSGVQDLAPVAKRFFVAFY